MKVDVLTLSAVAFVVGLCLSSIQLPETEAQIDPPPELLQGLAYIN